MIFLPAITAFLAIGGEYQPKRTLVYIFKPLTTLLIIWIAVSAPLDPIPDYNWTYKWLIVTGLVFCLGGDVFLMLPANYFIAGLASFLVGHLFYIAAFISDGGFHLAPGWLLPLTVYGFIFYQILAPGLGKLKGPVIAYILVILIMVWQALGRWSALMTSGAQYAAVGAAFFTVSDSFLAYDRFRQKFKPARVIVLATYWLAQWLIAMSVTTI